MKLICLNAWGGKIYQPFMDFIKKHSQDTDIFCFQEVFNTNTNLKESFGFRLNLLEEISRILPKHQSYFAPCVDNYIAGAFQPNFTDFNLSWGLVLFINNQIKIDKSGDFFVYRGRNDFDPNNLDTLPRNTQYISFENNGGRFTICNLHGIWLKEGKNDTPSRVEQSKKILSFFNQQKGGKILVGDFNLNLNTKSIGLLEESLINLIRENNIQTTRNKFFPGEDKFADYTFVSPNVNVLDFQVPNIEVSDHLPMILEFA